MNLLLMLSLMSQVNDQPSTFDNSQPEKSLPIVIPADGHNAANKKPAIGLDGELPPPEIKIPRHVKDVKKWWAYEKRMAVLQMTKDARKQYVLELRRAHAMYKRAGRKWRIAAGIPAMKHHLARTSVNREVGRFWLQASLHKRGRAPSPWKVPLYKIEN